MGKKKCVAINAESGFYEQVRDVFVAARQFVHKTANFAMVKAYWLVGKMIVEKQGGEAKAVYGDKLIVTLSSRLTEELHGLQMPPRVSAAPSRRGHLQSVLRDETLQRRLFRA